MGISFQRETEKKYDSFLCFTCTCMIARVEIREECPRLAEVHEAISSLVKIRTYFTNKREADDEINSTRLKNK